MKDKEIDQTLAKRFKQMRSEEIASTPDFPEESVLREPEVIPTQNTTYYRDRFNRVTNYLPQIAASFVLLAMISIFATNEPEEDTAEIYAEIMRNHESMATDHLLVVSETLLPAMNNVPEFYDTELNLNIDLSIGLETELELYTN